MDQTEGNEGILSSLRHKLTFHCFYIFMWWKLEFGLNENSCPVIIQTCITGFGYDLTG